jgi:hypothetical protein
MRRLQGQAQISVQQTGHQSANYVGVDLGICDHATVALITSESVPHPTLRGLPGAPAWHVTWAGLILSLFKYAAIGGLYFNFKQ